MEYIWINYIYVVTDLLIKCILRWYVQCSCLQHLLLELAENVQSRTYEKRFQTYTIISDYLKRGWSILQVYLIVSFLLILVILKEVSLHKVSFFSRWHTDCPNQTPAEDSVYWYHQPHIQLSSLRFNDGGRGPCSHYKWSMLVICLLIDVIWI